MAVKRLTDYRPHFTDNNGVLAANYRLWFYLAGSSSKANTYNSSTGAIANSNPIVLNARGEPPVEIWLTTGVNYKVGLSIAGTDDPPASFIWQEDVVAGINDATVTLDQWVAGPAPTYISATSFTLVGDQTSTFHLGRRLKTTNSGGTIYSTIIASAFGALTTVTVANDSGILDSGLSAVSYSLNSATNTSIDADMIYRKGTAVASAATTDIWSIAGDYVHITGSTGPITSLGTAPYAGDRRWLIFDSTPTLTHGTNLKLPGDQDVVAAANDVALVIADTTTAHRISSYVKAFSRPAQFGAKFVQGLTYGNNAGDAVNDLDIFAGACRDSTDAMDMVLGATLVKQSDVAWAVGTGLGGLDTGAVGNSDYYIWLIKRSDTGVVDALYSLSSTAPTMPTNYDFKRRIGWFKRVGGTIVAFTTYEVEGGGYRLAWSSPTQDVNLANTLTTSRRTDAVKVPLNYAVLAHLTVGEGDATTVAAARIMCPDETDVVVSGTNANIIQGSTGFNAYQKMSVMTSSAGLIAARANLATVDVYTVLTDGFTDARRT